MRSISATITDRTTASVDRTSSNSPASSSPPIVAGQHDRAFAVEPHDVWLALESAEHERDATVLLHMRNGLGSAAHQIEIGHVGLVENPERVVALRRKIDPPIVA